MSTRKTRDYEVSLWSLQDSFIAVLKQYGLEYKGQIENGKLQSRDDGTQTFSFTIPMYYIKEGKRIKNPAWYSVKSGTLLVNMRKIKVIFNKDNADRKIYEFLIVKVKERHDNNNSLYCDIQCEGLAFHELGKIGYKISLSPDDFYADDSQWSSTGIWYDGYGNLHTEQPLATLNYWNAKVFSTIDNWIPEIHMNWDSYSLTQSLKHGVEQDYIPANDIISLIQARQSDKIYEDDFVDSWKTDNLGNLVPNHIMSACEKARVGIEISESNIYNITQTLAEQFGVFCKYVYEYDDNFHITGRKVIYYNNFLQEENNIVDINYKYQTNSISREIDSTDLITKLFVKNVENSNSQSGLTNIINVDANQSKEDYILNFDYLYKIGGITDEQYAAVQKYILQIRAINEQITPLSIQIMSLQEQLVQLEAQLAVRVTAMAKDNEEIYSATELLMSLTKNSGVLSVSNVKPQIAVLFKDTAKDYDSYYVKISQKGVYPETIHLYKSYTFAETKLSDEITTGQIEYDEFGNVIRISNIYVDESESKTIYLTYDYKPSLYYERIENMWRSRLMLDTDKKNKLEQDIGKIKFILYGSEIDSDLTNIDIGNITVYNLTEKYETLLNKKENIIKQFNLTMGPAIREGYWQPEEYTDYGDKYTDNFSLGSLLNGQNNVGISGNTQLFWDNELFDNEQPLSYQYGITESKTAYPCINLLEHPQLLEFIKENVDNNVGFYFTPLAADSANSAANHRPVVVDAPKTINIVSNLYTGNSWTRNSSVTSEYGSNYDYSPYSGILLQTVSPGSYKAGYSYFYWQVKKSENDAWETVTSYYDTGNSQDLQTRYGYFIVGDNTYKNYINNNKSSYVHLPTSNIDYTKNIRFTNNNDYPWEIQIRSTETMNLDGWQFRLVMGNNKGVNLNKNNEWDNAQYSHITPTKIHLLSNTIEVTPASNNQDYYIAASSAQNQTVELKFNILFNDLNNKDYRYKLQYSYNDGSYQALTTTSSRVRIKEAFNVKSTSDQSAVGTVKITLLNSWSESDHVSIRVLAYNIASVANKVNGNIDYYISKPSNITTIIPGKLYYTRSESELYAELDTINKTIYAKIYFAALEADVEYLVQWYKYDSTASLIPLSNLTEQKQQQLYKDPATGLFVIKFELSQLNISNTDELINGWDGKYICAHIMDNNGNELLNTETCNDPLKIDICVPIVIITDLEPTVNVGYNNQTTVVSYNIDALNAATFKWHIYNQILDNEIILTVNSRDTEVSESNRRYVAKIKTNNNAPSGSVLTIEIPPSTDSNYYRDQSSLVYCEVYNISDNYAIDTTRASYKLSKTSHLILPGTVTMDNTDGNNVIEKELWYCKDNPNSDNDTDWFNIPLNLKFKKFPDGSISPTNINVSVSCSIPINYAKPYTIPEYNNYNYTNNTYSINYSGNKYVDVPIFKLVPGESMQVTTTQYIYPITLSTIITSYDRYQAIDELNAYIFNTTNTVNDKKYGYYYRLLVTYNYNNANFSEVFYIKGIIRQHPPTFNSEESARKWTYIKGNLQVSIPSPPGPTTNYMKDCSQKDYHSGAIFLTPSYTDSNGVVYSPPKNVAECEQWNHGFMFPVSEFNFNMDSVAHKQWSLPFGAYARSKIYTGPNYSLNGVNYNAVSSTKSFYSAEEILETYDNYAGGAAYRKLTSEERNFWERFRDGEDLPIIRYITTMAVPGIIDLCYLVNNEQQIFLWGLSQRLVYKVSNTWGEITTPLLVWQHNYSRTFKTYLDVAARLSIPTWLYQC